MLEVEGKHRFSASMPNFYEYYGHQVLHQYTYDLPIENASNPDMVDARIWFFGTGRADCLGSGGMNCVRRDQIEWFKHRCSELDKDDTRRGNGIAFMHHALQEHMHLVNHYPVHG